MLLAGCSLDLSGESDAAAAASDAASTPVAEGAGDVSENEDAVVDPDSAAAGVDLTGLGEPAATAVVPAVVEGDPEATMTVATYALQRRGETVVATFSFRVESEAADPAPARLYDYLGGFWYPYAVDTVNLAKHEVVESGGTKAVTSDTGMRYSPGQTFYAYAVFAAPPQDVTTMDASLGDGVPMATEVPLR